MNKNTFRSIVTYIIIYLYIFLLLNLSIKNASFKEFCRKIIGLFKNREIGECVLIILFFIIPISLIVWISGLIGKKLRRKK